MTSDRDAGQSERFRLHVPGECNAPLIYMMQLMAALESVRAGMRWLVKTQEDSSDFQRRDILMATIAGCGWCCEAHKHLKSGADEGLIDASMLDGNSEVRDLWDQIAGTGSTSPILSKIKRLRDKCFAHWDLEVFQNFERRLSQNADDPAMETVDGRMLNSRFLWPLDAIALDTFGDLGHDLGAARLVRDFGKVWANTAYLLSVFLAGLIKKHGLKLVPVE